MKKRNHKRTASISISWVPGHRAHSISLTNINLTAEHQVEFSSSLSPASPVRLFRITHCSWLTKSVTVCKSNLSAAWFACLVRSSARFLLPWTKPVSEIQCVRNTSRLATMANIVRFSMRVPLERTLNRLYLSIRSSKGTDWSSSASSSSRIVAATMVISLNTMSSAVMADHVLQITLYDLNKSCIALPCLSRWKIM